MGKVTSLDSVARPSEERLAVLMVIAYLGTATRRDVEHWRGEDSESLLDRLVAKGFLEKVRDTAPRAPNVFRLTTAALASCGFPTLEALQAHLATTLSARDVARITAWASGPSSLPVARSA